jgi:hypothetical protein
MRFTYLLRFQLLLKHRLPLMQPTEPVNLLLVLATNFIIFTTGRGFVGPGELRGECVSFFCACCFLRGEGGAGSLVRWVWSCYGVFHPQGLGVDGDTGLPCVVGSFW